MDEPELNILNNNINEEFINFKYNFMKNDLLLGLQLVKNYIIDNDFNN